MEVFERIQKHPFLSLRREGRVPTLETVGRAIGQYWHPIHFFPDFLASVVANAPTLEVKTYVSKILFQELGEGNPKLAHEDLYISTMLDCGFSIQTITKSKPSESTLRLMQKYRLATRSFEAGLGVLLGTEMIDIYIVAGLRNAVILATGRSELPWFDIHVKQEPDHTDCSERSLDTLSGDSKAQVEGHRDDILRLWSAFFDELEDSASNRVSATLSANSADPFGSSRSLENSGTLA